jgi:ketosteroid isomerase-like protein
MITKEYAEAFAAEWIAAWNSHDLDRVLTHYTDDFTIESPTALAVVPESKGFIAGKENIRRYWQTALDRLPDLAFELLAVFVGVHGVSLHFRNMAINKLVIEVMNFDEQGKVKQVLVYHKG